MKYEIAENAMSTMPMAMGMILNAVGEATKGLNRDGINRPTTIIRTPIMAKPRDTITLC